MGFLFPLYLLAAIAVVVPVLLHLRRRPPRERVEFSSLMFLRPHPPAREKRTRLERLMLLALRCLAILLLGLLFARPFWREEGALAELGEGALRVILVDGSASMQRSGLWEEARKALQAEVANAQPSDRLAVVVFGAGTETLLDFAGWKRLPLEGREAAAWQRVREWKPGWTATDLGGALVDALGLLEEESAGRLRQRQAEVVVVSDWQSGAKLEALERFSWPSTVPVRRILVQPPGGARSNAALHLVANPAREGADGEDKAIESAVRVRVSNALGSDRERFRVLWEGGQPGRAVDVVLPAGSTRVVTAPPRTGGEVTLRLEGDEEVFDNRVFVAPERARPVSVLVASDRVKEEDAGDPLFYVRRALSETKSLLPELRVRAWADLGEADLAWAEVLVLAGGAPDFQVPQVERFLESGGMVWLPLWEGAEGAKLPVMRQWGVTIREAKLDDYAMWTGLDFQHPLLRPFAPAALRDFSKIHVWRYRELVFPGELPQGAEVVARYDKGGVALLLTKVGKGQLCVLPGGWLPRDSQLALSSKFVPLLYSLLRQAGYELEAKAQFTVGEELPGGTVAREPGLITGKETTGKDRGQGAAPVFAINLPVAESDLEPLDEGALIRLGLPLAQTPAGGTGAGAGEDRLRERERLLLGELEGKQRLWRWLALGALLVLLGETWLSGRAGSTVRPQPAA